MRGDKRIKIVVAFCVKIEERFAKNVVCVLAERAPTCQGMDERTGFQKDVASLISVSPASRIADTQ